MRRFRSFHQDERGATIVEFALVLPLLAMLLLGILGYGQYFLLAHSAQQLANDAARATVAGLSPGERLTIANAAVARSLSTLPELKPQTVSLAVTEASELVTVRVRIDASGNPMFRVPLVPMPDPLIERRAVVRQGGFG
ncbi:pilus assembly protein [Sphingomonas sp. SUN019]|uniref:TadE/TadG family type IV pilus assembly protein n=1 Tax=Sphingomonas sp. SUN019 TaxID=2937788 RepID=UPI002164ACFA|nr:TadE/TadG family type IV pilus assembly protein [Sphingomonas sp. SUN019]UVO51837.1 pilus assembly protein [Sphingomonas sp. SUN019]